LRRNQPETVGAAGYRRGQQWSSIMSAIISLRRMSGQKPKLAIATVFSAVLVGVAIWALAGPPATGKKIALHHVAAHQ
jgi:hypothetical protein